MRMLPDLTILGTPEPWTHYTTRDEQDALAALRTWGLDQETGGWAREEFTRLLMSVRRAADERMRNSHD